MTRVTARSKSSVSAGSASSVASSIPVQSIDADKGGEEDEDRGDRGYVEEIDNENIGALEDDDFDIAALSINDETSAGHIDPDLLAQEEKLKKRNRDIQKTSREILRGTEELLKQAEQGTINNSNNTIVKEIKPIVKGTTTTAAESTASSTTKFREKPDFYLDLEEPIEDPSASSSSANSSALLRFQKAKFKVLTEQVEELTQELLKKDDTIKTLNRDYSASLDTVKSLEKRINQLQLRNNRLGSQVNQLQKDHAELLASHKALESKLASSSSISGGAKSAAASKNNNSSNLLNAKIDRLTEQLDRIRDQKLQAERDLDDSRIASRRELDLHKNQIKALQKDKNELIAGLKKQAQLIDVLKRQKIHLEAGAWLQLAEKEFLRQIDWAESN